MSATNVSFTLNELNSSATLIGATIPHLDVPDIADTFSAQLDVKLADVRALFKFQTDAQDMTDVSGTDVTYTCTATVLDAMTNGSAGGDVALNPAEALMIKGESTGWTENEKKLVQHDIIRKLCKHYFNTEQMADHLENEKAIRTALLARGVDFMADFRAAVVFADQKTNLDTGNSNLGKRLMEQLSKEDNYRLVAGPGDDTVNDTSANQSVPFVVGDTIECSWTLSEATGQGSTDGFTAGATASGAFLPVLYRIVFKVVSDDAAQLNYTDVNDGTAL